MPVTIPAYLSDTQALTEAAKLLTRGIDDTQARGTLDELFGTGGAWESAASTWCVDLPALPTLPVIPSGFTSYDYPINGDGWLFRKPNADDTFGAGSVVVLYQERGTVTQRFDVGAQLVTTPLYVAVRVQRDDSEAINIAIELARLQAQMLCAAVAYVLQRDLPTRARFDDADNACGIHSVSVTEPASDSVQVSFNDATSGPYGVAGCRVDVLMFRQIPPTTA